jgi:hypothetical protein
MREISRWWYQKTERDSRQLLQVRQDAQMRLFARAKSRAGVVQSTASVRLQKSRTRETMICGRTRETRLRAERGTYRDIEDIIHKTTEG